MPEVSRAIVRDREDAGRFVMVEQHSGLWTFPGGFVESEDKETPQEAAVREFSEETGFTIELEDKQPVFERSLSNAMKMYAFLGSITGGSRRINHNELLSVESMTFSEIRELGDAGKLRDEFLVEALTDVELNAYSRH